MSNTYVVKTGIENMDVTLIHSYLTRSYWAENISLTLVQKSLENSLCFGVFVNEPLLGDNNVDNKKNHTQVVQQVAFARVITDKATFAYLGDVFVLESHRQKGLSKCLMQTIEKHPELQGIRRFMLATSDAHGLYQQFGFSAPVNPQVLMEKWLPNIYKKTAK